MAVATAAGAERTGAAEMAVRVELGKSVTVIERVMVAMAEAAEMAVEVAVVVPVEAAHRLVRGASEWPLCVSSSRRLRQDLEVVAESRASRPTVPTAFGRMCETRSKLTKKQTTLPDAFDWLKMTV